MLKVKENGAYTLQESNADAVAVTCQTNDGQMTDKCQTNDGQVSPEIKLNEIKLNENIKESGTRTPKQERSIIPPTLEMVRAYCQERGNGIDPQHFIDYYEARGWQLKNGKMKDWQAAVRTWEGNQSSKPSQPSGITPAAKQINTMMTRETGLSDLEARLVANWK